MSLISIFDSRDYLHGATGEIESNLSPAVETYAVHTIGTTIYVCYRDVQAD